MKQFKRLLSCLLAGATAISMMFVGTVSAGAESIENTAKLISSGSKVSGTMYDGESLTYKVNVNKKGILKINFTAKCDYLAVFVYDKNGNRVNESDVEYVSGKSWSIYDIGESYIDFGWNEILEKIVANLQYTVDKGTYYIEFYSGRDFEGSGKLNFTATFPSSSSYSSSAKIRYLSMTLKKGSSIQLGTVLTSSTSSATKWSTSNSSVVSVTSKGRITAKKKGTAIITAKLGSSTAKLRIKVS